jgi:methionyl-tRNA formyltransferase
MVSTLDGIEDGTIRAVEQQHADGVSYASKITVDDARVDFNAPAHVVDRLVRAMTPEPGAWAEFRGERLKLGPVKLAEGDDLPPGEIKPGEIRAERKRVLVGTATKPVQLGEVQAQGKKRMAATDWARGARVEQGERLS